MLDVFDESAVSQEILEKFPKIDYKYLKLEKNASEGLITGAHESAGNPEDMWGGLGGGSAAGGFYPY